MQQGYQNDRDRKLRLFEKCIVKVQSGHITHLHSDSEPVWLLLAETLEVVSQVVEDRLVELIMRIIFKLESLYELEVP